jgi:hypothetical protein
VTAPPTPMLVVNRHATLALTCLLFSCIVFAEPQYQRPNTALVCIDVMMTDHLSGSAFSAMRNEAARIWRRYGIILSWSPPSLTACDVVVPLTFDAERLRLAAGGSDANALALTVFYGRSRVVYVSLPRVFQLLARLRQIASLSDEGERDYRGGTLIGRVVAHELGHVLLLTTSHSQRGLMRPVFGLRDVRSVDDGTTELSSRESALLAMRFSVVPVDSPQPSAVAVR